jgi:hypothetical protein
MLVRDHPPPVLLAQSDGEAKTIARVLPELVRGAAAEQGVVWAKSFLHPNKKRNDLRAIINLFGNARSQRLWWAATTALVIVVWLPGSWPPARSHRPQGCRPQPNRQRRVDGCRRQVSRRPGDPLRGRWPGRAGHRLRPRLVVRPPLLARPDGPLREIALRHRRPTLCARTGPSLGHVPVARPRPQGA